MNFCIFSYNRGRFLDNCVKSIEDCAPGSRLVIYDDQSNDPETLEVLARQESRHVVIKSESKSTNKHGGLYHNMQTALESCPKDELVCFLQDDTQLVRQIADEEKSAIHERFERDTTLGFISPAFIRNSSIKRKGAGAYIYDLSSQLYYWQDSQRSAGVYYSDIFVTLPKRLTQNNWRFVMGEPANEQQARGMFTKMGYLPSPFLMWLPNSLAYRGKKKTISLKIAERVNRCGFYPFAYMTSHEVNKLADMADTPPVAEDCLQLLFGPLPKPWIFNPLQKNRILRLTNKIELFFNRLAGQ
ncbi:MAG: hypothetical protein WD572_08555 [Gammaproteobacteria bacterium]